MSKITKVVSRQMFDSRGMPTIETEIFCGKVSSKAICPSGASTGSYEAFEKRDISNKKYLGKSARLDFKLGNKQFIAFLKWEKKVHCFSQMGNNN